MAEERQVIAARQYYQNALGVWVPVTAATPLPVSDPARAPVRLVTFIAGRMINVLGYGPNVYLSVELGGGATISPAYPVLYRTGITGVLEPLLTFGEMQILSHDGVSGNGLVAVMETPDRTIFASTHTFGSILRKKLNQPWESVWFKAAPPAGHDNTCYGMAAESRGAIFFTWRTSDDGTGAPKRAIMRSTDGGDTWTEVYTEAVDLIFSINCHDNIVIAAGEGCIFRSTDRGLTFNKILTPITYFKDVVPLGNGKWMMFDGYNRLLCFSFNDGLTWEIVANTFPVRATGYQYAVSISNGIIILAPWTHNLIPISQDEGATWTVFQAPLQMPGAHSCYLMGRTAFIGSWFAEGYYRYQLNIGQLAIIELTELVPPAPQSFEMLSLASLVAGATSTFANCKPLLCNRNSMSITAECTYNVAATIGLRVHVRSSHDGTNYDDADLYVFDNEFTANTTKRKTVELDPKVRFIKVLAENLDGVAGHDITSLKVTATLRG